jgi:hypothetical protein
VSGGCTSEAAPAAKKQEAGSGKSLQRVYLRTSPECRIQ